MAAPTTTRAHQPPAAMTHEQEFARIDTELATLRDTMTELRTEVAALPGRVYSSATRQRILMVAAGAGPRVRTSLGAGGPDRDAPAGREPPAAARTRAISAARSR